MPSVPPNNRKYYFTPEMTESLRSAWAAADGLAELREAVGKLSAAFGFPRSALNYYAASLGLTKPRTRWQPAEIAYLRANAGIEPMNRIAKHLKRSYHSVKVKASQLQVSMRAWQGYSGKDVMGLLHVGRDTLQLWSKRGWLTPDVQGAYTQGALEQFLRKHLDAVDLRRVEQAWLQETLTKLLQPSQDTTAYDRVASGGTNHCLQLAPGGYNGFGATEATEKRAQRERMAA